MIPLGVTFSLLLVLIPIAVILCFCQLGKRADEEDLEAAKQIRARQLRDEFERDRQHVTMGDLHR